MPNDDTIPAAAGRIPSLVTPSAWEAMRQKVEAMEILPDPQEFIVSRRGNKTFFRLRPQPSGTTSDAASLGASHPFEVSIRQNEDGDWECATARGLVVGRYNVGHKEINTQIPTGTTTLDGTTTWKLIADGESVFVKVKVDPDGGWMLEVPTIEVLDTLTTDPSGTAGLAGYVFYELMRFTIVDDLPVVVPYCAGSHIYHTPFGWCGDIVIESTDGKNALLRFSGGDLQKVRSGEDWITGTKDAPGTVYITTKDPVEDP